MFLIPDTNSQGNVEYFRLLLSDSLKTSWKGLCPQLLLKQFPPCLCHKLPKDKPLIKKANLIFVNKIKLKSSHLSSLVIDMCVCIHTRVCIYIHTPSLRHVYKTHSTLSCM